MGILSIWDSNSANSCFPLRDQAPRPAVDMSSFDSPQQSNDNITDQYFLGGATTWKTYSWVSHPVVLHTLITISFDYGLLRSFIPTSHISGLHVWSAVLGRVMSGCLLSKHSCFHVGCNNTMWPEPASEHCRDNRDGCWCLYSFDTSVCSILR